MHCTEILQLAKEKLKLVNLTNQDEFCVNLKEKSFYNNNNCEIIVLKSKEKMCKLTGCISEDDIRKSGHVKFFFLRWRKITNVFVVEAVTVSQCKCLLFDNSSQQFSTVSTISSYTRKSEKITKKLKLKSTFSQSKNETIGSIRRRIKFR